MTTFALLHPEEKGILESSRTPEAKLEEAAGLIEALGDTELVYAEIVQLQHITPATYIGGGKADEMKELCEAEDIDVVMLNCQLSPTQQRNLEKRINKKVVDRTGLILEIFAQRARTKAGRLQVELARLTYEVSRLVRTWTHLERQRGGMGKTGGPGERQIELDRRMLRDRIAFLKTKLKTIEKQRALHRRARERNATPVIALVGYTNAGKSTLFNALVKHAAAESKDQLFATLDPLMRKVKLPSGKTAILADTVGFVSDLPHQLVEAFHATLEEVASADLLLHVFDAAAEDREAQQEDVNSVLKMLEAEDVPQLRVANKTDISEGDAPEAEAYTSALNNEGLEDLLLKIDSALTAQHPLLTLNIPVSDGKTLAYLHRHGHIEEKNLVDDHWHVVVRLGVEYQKEVEDYLK